jgi:uncharacterized membrane protein
MLDKVISKKYSLVILLMVLMNFLVLFNVPFLRPVIVFLILTFLPGFLIVQSLNLNIESIKKILLSIGISLSFIMIYFITINFLSIQLGYMKPLTPISILVSFNIALVSLTILASRLSKSKDLDVFKIKFDMQLSITEKLFLIFAVFFPVLSFLGVYLINYGNINFVILLLYVFIALYVVLITIFYQKATNRLYMISILLISLSLVLLLPLRSSHIIGADTNLEYYYYTLTLKEAQWIVLGSTSLDACLSISILPAIYQLLSNITAEVLFKFIFPIICSVIPLCIYVISKKYVKNSYAFLAAVFFISQALFINLGANSRTFIAIFFVALLAMVLFEDHISDMKKVMLFILFLFSLILSHYTTAYITFIIILTSFVGTTMFSYKYKSKSFLTAGIVVLFFSLMFFWYGNITQHAFNSGVDFFVDVLKNLNQMFLHEARTSAIQEATGSKLIHGSIAYKINFILNWAVLFVIFIGVTSMIVKFKNFILGFKNKNDFLESKVEPLYFMIVCACFAILVIVFAVPTLTQGYDMSRPYSLTLIFLSSVFIFGALIITKIIKIGAKKILNFQINFEKTSYIVILLMIIPFFFSVTGTYYAISGNPQSVILSSSNDDFKKLYITDSDSLSAKWLNETMTKKAIITDHWGKYRLVSQGGINFNYILEFNNTKKSFKMYQYLRNNSLEDIHKYQINSNIIYDNGNAEIGDINF